MAREAKAAQAQSVFKQTHNYFKEKIHSITMDILVSGI
jgi:hypothetical protein